MVPRRLLAGNHAICIILYNVFTFSLNSVDPYQLASDDKPSLSGSICIYLREELNIDIEIKFKWSEQPIKYPVWAFKSMCT